MASPAARAGLAAAVFFLAQILLFSDGVLGDRLSLAGFTELCEDVAAAPGWTPASLIGRLRATSGGTFDDDCALVQLTF